MITARSLVRATCGFPLVWLLLHCFEPQPADCLPCTQACPSGQDCIDGLCQRRAQQCTLGANTSQCGEQCCLDGVCFDLKRHIPPDSLALWLDWTSLYEGDSSPVWRDRSVNQHSFRNNGTSPSLARSATSDTHVLRFSALGQFLALEGPEQSALDAGDFLLLVAGSLHCAAPKAAKQCLIARVRSEEANGLRLCATLDSELPSSISTCAERGSPATCVSAVASGVPCERMELFTLRRTSIADADGGTPQTSIELRHNGVARADAAIDPGLELEALSSLRIGGRSAQSWLGEVALVILIRATLRERETCELERFVMSRMAAAHIDVADELPDCSALAE